VESTIKKGDRKTFSVRDVVKVTFKDRIYDLVSKETDQSVGHKNWIKHYPTALSNVIDELTETELAEAESTAEEWNNNRPPGRFNACKYLSLTLSRCIPN